MKYDITSEHGFEQMYHEYYSKLYNYVFYQILSREDTEDIISNVFMKAARYIGTYDESKATVSTWLYKIAKNTLIDFFRARKVECFLDDEGGIRPEMSVDFEEQLEQISAPTRRIIYKELTKLKWRDRLIVYYKFFEGYNNCEIARMLKMNESTVGTALSRALVKLRTDTLRAL
ncbi:RNA polymerase sigma factor [Christensenellaceae bacterium OttesenSCG-928-K19]|nr:RNA polymerase sigma factor [Christensenellaceae bacterium OttesenSCG-928-K19]